MNATARFTSSSVRSLLPPRGGIARMPLIACSNASLSPARDDLGPRGLVADLRRARQAGFVTRLADLAVDGLAGQPCPWGRLPPPARRCRRAGCATARGCRFRGAPCSPLVTSCEISTATAIGTAKASSTTMTSCFGVLIGEECSSVMVAGGVFGRRGRAPARARHRRLRQRNARLYRCGPCPRPHWTASRPDRYNARAHAPVAQLDRVLVSEAKGHRFESCRARHIPPSAPAFARLRHAPTATVAGSFSCRQRACAQPCPRSRSAAPCCPSSCARSSRFPRLAGR